MAWLVRRVGIGALAHVPPRGDAQRLFRLHVHEGRGDLAVVLDAQGAMAHRAPRGNLDAVRETAIGLHDHQQALIAPRGSQPQRGRAGQPDARAQHLPRAQVAVPR
ncbi:MAG: hypothetical protein AUK03_06030 [Anaerolineae bacterium CG2_30_64_16]|nr:MAG: hypothetical protein AUK03_06030 [Anaerolineae bacterium CG2_30_64_16]